MKEVDFLASELYKRYGAVTRARNCFLYTKKGVRLTDMYQEAGRAILGWGGNSAYTVLKNILNRGITGFFYTEQDFQLVRAVNKLLGSKNKVYVYRNLEEAKEASKLNLSKESIKKWIPWNWEKIDYSTESVLVIEPCLAFDSEHVLLVVKENELSSEQDAALQESSVHIAAPVIAAITRAIYNMIAEFPLREEKNWFLYDPEITKYWVRKGPYLFPKMDKKSYPDFIKHCLDCGIVISPIYEQPSIIPFGADRGVFGKLKNNIWDASVSK